MFLIGDVYRKHTIIANNLTETLVRNADRSFHEIRHIRMVREHVLVRKLK